MMPIDATVPTTADLVSALAGYGQDERAFMNMLETAIAALGAAATYTELEVAGGVTVLITGTHVSAVPLEVVRITGAIAVNIQNISGGSNGQRKVFYFADTNVTIDDNDAMIDLNQLPTGGSFVGSVGDILTLVRIDNIWREEYRNLKL
jgi:hypothetical protein